MVWNTTSDKNSLPMNLGAALSKVNAGTVTKIASSTFPSSTVDNLLNGSSLIFAAPTDAAFTPSIVSTFQGLSAYDQRNLLANHFADISKLKKLDPNTNYIVPSLGDTPMSILTDAFANIKSINNLPVTTRIATQNGSILASIPSVILPNSVQLLANCTRL